MQYTAALYQAVALRALHQGLRNGARNDAQRPWGGIGSAMKGGQNWSECNHREAHRIHPDGILGHQQRFFLQDQT